jgi:hypothetical protein
MNTNLYIGETDSRDYTLVLALNPVCVLWRGDEYALESGENLIENLTLERAIKLFNSVCNTNYDWHFFANEWMRWYKKLGKRADGTRRHIDDVKMTTAERTSWLRAHPEEIARIKAKYGLS